MKTVEMLTYAVAAALAAAMTVALFGGAAVGFWALNWTPGQAAFVGVAATVAGIVTATAFLQRIVRAERRRLSKL